MGKKIGLRMQRLSTGQKLVLPIANTNSLPIAAIGFGWCWDMVGGWVSSGIDPVYGCHWYGYSKGGPENKISDGSGREWGLDAADYSITGNSVSMDTYLSVTQQYIDYCTSNGYSTKVFFTTGPVDDSYTNGEAGYQGHIKHEYIRNYVKADPTRILFDYADILCYDDNGTPTTATWNGHTFPRITTTNLGFCKYWTYWISRLNKTCKGDVVDAGKNGRMGWRHNINSCAQT